METCCRICEKPAGVRPLIFLDMDEAEYLPVHVEPGQGIPFCGMCLARLALRQSHDDDLEEEAARLAD